MANAVGAVEAGPDVARMLLKRALLKQCIELNEPAQTPQRQAMVSWAQRHLTGYVSPPEERVIAVGAHSATNTAVSVRGQAEWVTVLAWALGLVPEVPEPAEELQALTLPLYPSDPSDFIGSAKVTRGADEVAALGARLIRSSAEWLARYPLVPQDKGDDAKTRARALERADAAMWLSDLVRVPIRFS